ncbi:MAG TPA: transposase [Puia sp.]|nr:transposase [Puia sp.]
MKISYKYRLYLNQEQQQILQNNFNFCCFLYNSALQERNDYYNKFKKSLSYNSQSAELPAVKEEFALQTQSIYSQSLQQVLKRLDSSYKNFFRRVKSKADKVGFPRFKSGDRFKSIVFPQSDLTGFGVKLLANQKLKIFGLPGEIKVNWHRPYQGQIKQVILKRQGDKFYIILSCDEVPLELNPKTDKIIALDLGLNSFAITDDGTKFHHPKPYKTALEKLAYLNKNLAAKQQGSRNRRRAKSALTKAYQKITDIRSDFLHKLSNKLIKENDQIIIEKLNIKPMLEAKGFEVKKSNIQDASWARFASQLVYKAERAGRLIIEVNPANTSKMCSRCNNIKELSLKDREYHCEFCKLAMDRDHNAALNIRRLGTSLAI